MEIPLIVHCIAGQRGEFMAWLAERDYRFDEIACDVFVWGFDTYTLAGNMVDFVAEQGWTDQRHAKASMLAYLCEEGARS